MFFYRGTKLFAVRYGPYKAHFFTKDAYGSPEVEEHDPPLLYNLGTDPGEQYNVAEGHPEVIAEIRQVADSHRKAMVPGEPQLKRMIQR